MESPGETSQEPTRLARVTVVVFWALVGLFLVIVGVMTTREVLPVTRTWFIYTFFSAAAAFLVLGLVLLFLAVKAKVERALRLFLILTGASAAGFLVSAVLHNVVYGLFILWFGEDFWGGSNGGGDEAFFFIIAIFVCPLVFLVGVVGSIVMLIRSRRRSFA